MKSVIKQHVRRFELVVVATLIVSLFGGFAGAGIAQAAGVVLNKPAVVQNTGGGGVRIRGGAGAGYDVKGTLAEGTTVHVLEGPVKDKSGASWYRVTVDGRTGWVGSGYLGTAAAAAAAKAAPKAAAKAAAKPAAAKPAAKLTGYAKVANTGGDAIRLRSTAGGKVIATAGAGTLLSVKSGPVKDKAGVSWYQVAGANLSGWMQAEYLVGAKAPSAAAAKAAPAPKAVKTAAPAKAAAPAAAQARSGSARGAQPPAAARPSTAGGVLSVAMQYVGYRYRFGGTSPAGFDCSGFVYYVFNKAGISMSRSLSGQVASGTKISSSQLQPGDLVYFANTYKRGISHIGIYIGNGKIVHAAAERTGVMVSDLWSAYWAAHYAGAVRISR
ncbi:MAG TPA: SH3 domain-containing C40 family peptidase [Chloroflexia bacterium]|nr:SH3 domain-containing C40 family peptidase [Chloroflexia bacterium]